MVATTGYQAGVESDDVEISYIEEAVWGVTPAGQFTKIRITGESLTGTRARQRPPELLPQSEVAAAVTTQESAAGGINYALSYGTFDSFIASVMGADWQAPQVINGVAGDISLTSISPTSATLASTTANKFAQLAIGQWVRLSGWVNAGAANAIARVGAKASNQSLTLNLLAPVVTETPTGTNARVVASTIVNGALFKSLSLQKRVGTSQWLRYAGAHVPSMTLGGQTGGFMTGSFNINARSEEKATVDWSTGAVIAAPAGTVHDTVPGFGGVFRNEAGVNAGVVNLNLNLTRQNANAIYAMGQAPAAGMTRGSLEVTGDLEMHFRDFAHYDVFKAGTLGRVTFITRDSAGNAYVGTLLNAALLNPRIVAGGPGQPVTAAFTLEGNPQAGGGSMQFDRLPAT